MFLNFVSFPSYLKVLNSCENCCNKLSLTYKNASFMQLPYGENVEMYSSPCMTRADLPLQSESFSITHMAVYRRIPVTARFLVFVAFIAHVTHRSCCSRCSRCNYCPRCSYYYYCARCSLYS